MTNASRAVAATRRLNAWRRMRDEEPRGFLLSTFDAFPVVSILDKKARVWFWQVRKIRVRCQLASGVLLGVNQFAAYPKCLNRFILNYRYPSARDASPAVLLLPG